MSLEDDEDEMGSMSLTELLLKELEVEVLKPEHFEDDDNDCCTGDGREAHTPPPVFRNWQAALLQGGRNSRSITEFESGPSFGDVLDTVVSSADDQETFTSIINKCALETATNGPTSSTTSHNVPSITSIRTANNMMHPNFTSIRPLQGSLMGPPPGPIMSRPGFNMNGPPPGHRMNGPQSPMMSGPFGPMSNGPQNHMMNGPRGHMNGPRGPMHMHNRPMNRHSGPMNGPPGPMNRHPGPMNGHPGPMNGLPGPMNGPPGPMNGPPRPMNGPPGPMNGPPGPMNGPPGPMNGPPGPINGPPGPMNWPPSTQPFPNPMTMGYDMSFGMMNNSMPGYPVPNVFPNTSHANMPISVAAIPDTTLSTQLKSIKKKRSRKDINETTTTSSSIAATSTTSLPSESLPLPPSELSIVPPAPLPDNAPPSPLKSPALRHVKEHKIVMKLEKRTMKEPTHSGIASRATKTIIADYTSSSDESEKDKSESHRKKALHHSITSVRLGENEALPDLYSKLKKLNEELAMLQHQDEGSHSSSDTSDDEEEIELANTRKVDTSTGKQEGKSLPPLPPLPPISPSTVSPVRPNLDARIKMMMDDKATPAKKTPGPDNFVVPRRQSAPMAPPRPLGRPFKNVPLTRVPIPTVTETSQLKPLPRPPSPFLSTEIYHYWHKESVKFRKYRKKSHVPYVDPKGRHGFHKGRFVHIQSKPLRSQAARDIYSLLDKKLKDDCNLNTLSTQKKALLTEEIETDMKRLEAINRELKMLEEEEERNNSNNNEERDNEPSEDLRQLEELNKKWRELQADNEDGQPSSDSDDDDEDLKRLEELNRELRNLEEEEQKEKMEADGTDEPEPQETGLVDSNLIKNIVPNLPETLEPELVESVGGDLKRLEEINKALEEMETDCQEESSVVDRPDECYGKESNIPSINCLQESLAFQRARDISGDPIISKEPAEQEAFSDRGQKRPAEQELISMVMSSVMEELKKDLRNSIAGNLVNDKMLDYGPVPMKKQKTSVV